MFKFQNGGYVARLDNLRVVNRHPIAFKINKQLLVRNAVKKNEARIYDTKKAQYYLNMQNLYNTNFFGYGVSGNLTHYDPSKEEDLLKIQANFDYTKSNVQNVAANLLTTGIASSFKGVLPAASKRVTVGNLSDLTPYKIGLGAEALVINNSPTTVGKITLAGSGEFVARNTIPNSVPVKFVGYVKDGSRRLPTFILKKVKILTEEKFPKYLEKLDKAMEKSGFRKVNDPDVLYRAYTNGTIVVDDVSPGNVGVNIFGKPKLIDFNMQTVPEWIELGFTLK